MTRLRYTGLGILVVLGLAFATSASAQTADFYILNSAVGSGLQTGVNRVRLTDSQHGGVVVRVESPDTNLVRITDDENVPGGAFADIFVPNGSTDAFFYVQAMEDTTGMVTLTATAPGFAAGVDSIEVRTPALRISGLTSTIDPFDPVDTFVISVGLANAANTTVSPAQKVRVGGPGLTATLSTSDPSVAVLETSTLTAQVVSVAIVPGNSSSSNSVATGGAALDGLSAGVVAVDAVIPGFLPINSVPQNVTVTAPEITWIGMPADVGAGLQAGFKRARLSGNQHGGVTVTITSADSTKILIAPDETSPGAGSLSVFVPDGSIDAFFTVQALEGVAGDVPVVAVAAGFDNGFTTASAVQPFFRLSGLGSSIDTLDPVDAFSVSVGLPNGSFTTISPVQKARIGGPGLTATVTSSDPAVGLLETTSALQDTIVLVIPPGESNTPTTVVNGGLAFDGVGVGVSTVTASIPGFAPVSTAFVDVTVSQPSISTTNSTIQVGAGLRSGRNFATLGASQHGGVTVRIESRDPGLALVSNHPDSTGQAFFEVPVADGGTRADFYVHALEDTTGTLLIDATSSLFQPDSTDIAVVRPAVRLQGLVSTIDTIDPEDNFYVGIGIPNSSSSSVVTQYVRPGSPGFDIDLMTDDPAIGRIVTLADTSDVVTVSIPALSANSPTTVGAGGSAFDGVAPGVVRVEAVSPRLDRVTNDAKDITVTAPTIAVNAVSKLGWGLQAQGYATLSAGGHGGVTVRVESEDPAKMLIADAELVAGAAFVDITVPDGTTSINYYTQALDGQTGVADVLVSSPQFVANLDSVEIVQPGVEITSLGASQDVADTPDNFYVRVGVPTSNNSSVTSGFRQDRRGGAPPLEVLLVSSDGTVAEILGNNTSGDSLTVFIQPGQSQSPTSGDATGSALDGLSFGQTLVTAEIDGFIQTGAAQRTVDVSNLNITLNGLAGRLGAGLQSEAVSAELGQGGHGGVTVQVAVSDPALAVVSANAQVAGAETVGIPLGAGETEAVFYLQALDGSAGSTVNVTATVSGFAPGAQDVDLVPAGTAIVFLPDSLDVNVDDVDFVVQVGAITPDTTGIVEPQALRGGGPSRAVQLISSDGVIGLVTTQTATGDTVTLSLAPGERQTAATWEEGGVAFDPIYPGQTVVSAEIAGFLTTVAGMPTVTLTGEVTAVGEVPVAIFRLDQNVPNPFNPVTKISFSLDRAGPVDLAVYDLAGRKVASLVREDRPAGAHLVTWDGTDDRGGRVSSGVYFYKLETGDKVDVRKMTLLK